MQANEECRKENERERKGIGGLECYRRGHLIPVLCPALLERFRLIQGPTSSDNGHN